MTDTGGTILGKQTGLNPGASYNYTVHIDSGPALATGFYCTVPAVPAFASYYPVNTTSLGVSVVPNPLYPQHSSDFRVTIDSQTINVTAPDTSVIVSGLSAYTEYPVVVNSFVTGCTSSSFADELLSVDYTFTAYTAPNTPSVLLPSTSQTCVDYVVTADHIASPDVVYQLYRDDMLIREQLTSSDLSGSDCGLTPGTQYAYKVVVYSELNDFWNASAVASECTLPASVTILSATNPSNDTVSLNWAPGEGGVHKFVVMRDSLGTNQTFWANETLNYTTEVFSDASEVYNITVQSLYMCAATSSDKLDPSPPFILLSSRGNPPEILLENKPPLGDPEDGYMKVKVVPHADDVDVINEISFDVFRDGELIRKGAVPTTDADVAAGFSFVLLDDVIPASDLTYSAVSYYKGYASQSASATTCSTPSHVSNVRLDTNFAVSGIITWAAPEWGSNAPTSYNLVFLEPAGEANQTETATSHTLGASYLRPDGPIVVQIRPQYTCAGLAGSDVEGSFTNHTLFVPPLPPTLGCAVESSSSITINVQLHADNSDSIPTQMLLWRNGAFLSDTPEDNITIDDDLTPGVQYTYKAVVIQNGLQSDLSAECNTCPYPGQPQNAMTETQDHENIVLYFDSPLGYYDKFNFSDGTTATVETDNTVRSFTFTGLSPETEYNLTVATIVSCDVTSEGGAFDILSLEPVSVMAYTAPAQVNLTAIGISASEITVTFDHSPSSYKYHLWRDGVKILHEGSSESFTDSGLVPGTMYTYTGAVELNGHLSLVSFPEVAFTNPDVVTNVTLVSASKESLTISWFSPNGNAEGYLYTQNATSNSSALPVTTTSAEITGLTANTLYSIDIHAIINNVAGTYPVQISEPVNVLFRTSMDAPSFVITEGPDASSLTIDFDDGVLDSDLMERKLMRVNPDGTATYLRAVTDTYDDSGLTFASEYSYTAMYVGLNGFEGESSNARVYCTGPEEPNFPRLSSTDAATGAYHVSWNHPQTMPTSYDVYVVDSSSSGSSVNVVGGLTADISALISASAETYQIGVTSVFTCASADSDGSGVASTDLESDMNSTITVYAAPGQPNLAILSPNYPPTGFELNVTLAVTDFDTGSVSVDIYRTLDGVDEGIVVENAVAGIPFLDTNNLEPGTMYSYHAVAVYHEASSVSSPEVSGCTLPGIPLNFRVQYTTDGSVFAAWNAPNGGITDYEILDMTTPGASPVAMATLMGTAAVTEADITSLVSNTNYTIGVRSTFLCPADSATVYSDYADSVGGTTRPAVPVITSVTGLDTNSIQINFTTTDAMTGLAFTVFSKGIEVGSVSSGDAFFTHTGVLAGSENIYTLMATNNGLDSDLSLPFVGCSFPNHPSNVYFSPLGPNSIEYLWSYPADSAPDSGNVYYDLVINGTTDQDNLDGLGYVKTGLLPMESYNFSVVTVLVCDSGAPHEYLSSEMGATDYLAYTAPEAPVLALDGTSTVSSIGVTLENPGSNTWTSPYDKIRIFRDGFQVSVFTGTDDPFQLNDTGLVPATQYAYEAEVTWNRLTAYSDAPLYECTYPEVPQNLHAIPHEWYGINVFWEAPLGNTVTKFQIKINVTGEDDWEDVGLNYRFSVRNPATPVDFDIVGTEYNLLGFFTAKETAGVKTILPNSAYEIQVRALYDCVGTSTTYEGEPVSVTGMTAPYPPQAVALTPIDEEAIEVSWTVVTSPEVLTYDILQCDSNLTTCNTVASEVTTSPYTVTGLTMASFYCFDVVAKWNGMSTSVLRRTKWLTDYQDYLDSPESVLTEDVYFYETQLTFTNYTHGYYDTLCSCTYPPPPITIGWDQHISSGIYYTWTMPDLSAQRTQKSTLTSQNMTLASVAFYDNVAASEVELHYDTTEYIFDGFNPIESHILQVKSRLVCPDRKSEVADADSTVLDSQALNITGWTRPTIPTIDSITQESSNPDEDLNIAYSTPDTEVIYFYLDRDFSNSGLNDTALFKVDMGLTPGTAYNYSVYAHHQTGSGENLVSLPPTPTEGCTLPSDIPTLAQTKVDNVNSVQFDWTAPTTGQYIGFNYTSDLGTTFTFTTDLEVTLTDLDWCTQWTFDVYSVGDCGANPDVLSENPQSLSDYLTPKIPSIEATSEAVSDTEINVFYSDPNEDLGCAADILIYRDGEEVANLSAPGSGFHGDTGLVGASVYEYRISAARGSQQSLLSDTFVLCTAPTPLSAADVQCVPEPLYSRLEWASNSSSDVNLTYNIEITGDLTRSYNQVPGQQFRLGVFAPASLHVLSVTISSSFQCPKTSGEETMTSTGDVAITLDCYTLPDQVAITEEASDGSSLELSWVHAGGSDLFLVRITPFASENNDGGSQSINMTESTYIFTELDGKSTYTVEIINVFNGMQSTVATYEYDSSSDNTLIGLPFIAGVIVLVLVCIVAVALLGLLIFGLYKLVMFLKANGASAKPNTVEPDRLNTPEEVEEVDWTINNGYNLRAEYNATKFPRT